ncbi:MAG: hypothetical protein M1833_002831 [Piccolia ochrophora]|nr:MAG: hypothetical protein M1833_002831 [Piccolia ochrophora]
MASHQKWAKLAFALPFLCLPALYAQNNSFSSVEEAFPQLDSLNSFQIENPKLGTQDFNGYCCFLAINASFTVINDSVVPLRLFIDESVEGLRSKQWPCQASFEGDKAGAPVVSAPYEWVNANCPGWNRSQGSSLDDWAQLFVGFLLPAVAFCLIVPRQQELRVPPRLFDVELNRVSGLLSSPFLAITAGVLSAADTLYWLGAVFTFAGPMVLSGIYEAHLDKRLLLFLRVKIQNGRLSRTDRARILFAILMGNLDLHWEGTGSDLGQAWKDTQGLVSKLDTTEQNVLLGKDNMEGNNPNTLEGIVGSRAIERPYPTFPGFDPTYATGYKPAWMWNRGSSKQHWADALAKHYDMDDLESVVVTRRQDWTKITILSLFLLFAPCLLAFIVSYYTPFVGLGCRSFTFMMYYIFQVVLIFLWIWKYAEDHFSNARSVAQQRRKHVWFGCSVFCAAMALFFGIGGTLMQLIGVYRNSVCVLPTWQWISKKGFVELSSNSELAIRLAEDTWLPVGVTGSCFLGFGWWYNMYLRLHFDELVDAFDEESVGPSTFMHAKEDVPRIKDEV